MKKKMGAFILCFALLGVGCVFAEEEKTSPEIDPAATQMTETYPSAGACTAGEGDRGCSRFSKICRRSGSVCESLPALH